jgi:Transcriptional regulators
MLSSAKSTLNETLVTVFNQILRIEEAKLKSFGADLSVKEAHVIEAVIAAKENNTASVIATRLKVTIGSLTVAVNTLERKGYLVREKSLNDRRRIHILPTEKAIKVNELHAGFHEEMTEAVMATLPSEQLQTLITALTAVNAYFANEKE